MSEEEKLKVQVKFSDFFGSIPHIIILNSLYHQLKSCTPKNLDVPPKMKVKGYMYPQMKKPVGMLLVNCIPGYISCIMDSRNKNLYSFGKQNGVQRNLTAFSPHKVVHHAVFCKYYAELAKPFFSV
jgi:hypothetical protein